MSKGVQPVTESLNMSIYTHFSVAAATVAAAAAFSLSAVAQTPAPVSPPTPKVRDCSTAPHPDRCEAFKKAVFACKDKAAGAERHACVKSNMPPKPAAKSS
jgi:hypothetical protein